MTTIGLDLSLTSTGIAVIGSDQTVTVSRVQSKGSKTATLNDRRERIHKLDLAIFQHIVNAHEHSLTGPPLVVIEAPSFGQARQGGQHDRSGLWWLVVSRAGQYYDIAEVAPATRSKYATGKGNAAKDAVLAAVVRRYPQVDVTGNDEADALILAAMGARHLGQPIDDLPKTHLAAMDAVRWPTAGVAA